MAWFCALLSSRRRTDVPSRPRRRSAPASVDHRPVQRLEQADPSILLRPAHEAIIEGLRRPVDIPPCICPATAALQNVNDPLITRRSSTRSLPRVSVGGYDLRTLLVCRPEMIHLLLMELWITVLPDKPNLWVQSLVQNLQRAEEISDRRIARSGVLQTIAPGAAWSANPRAQLTLGQMRGRPVLTSCRYDGTRARPRRHRGRIEPCCSTETATRKGKGCPPHRSPTAVGLSAHARAPHRTHRPAPVRRSAPP